VTQSTTSNPSGFSHRSVTPDGQDSSQLAIAKDGRSKLHTSCLYVVPGCKTKYWWCSINPLFWGIYLFADEIRDGGAICHEQDLRVPCSSSRTPGNREGNETFYKQQFGRSIAKWPVATTQNVSTSIEKSFKIPTIHFRTDEGGHEVAQQVSMNLKATATISLSCCRQFGHRQSKIRIKFSTMSAEIKNKREDEIDEESGEEADEELCNVTVLNYLCTNMSGACQSKQILLFPMDEFDNTLGKRVLAEDEFSWIEADSGMTFPDAYPASTSVVLRDGIRKRPTHHKGVTDILHFREKHRPVTLEGYVEESSLPTSPSIQMRQRLKVSYFKPSTPISEKRPVCPGDLETKVINFDCFFDIGVDEPIAEHLMSQERQPKRCCYSQNVEEYSTRRDNNRLCWQ
jgi:hypothetical protein